MHLARMWRHCVPCTIDRLRLVYTLCQAGAHNHFLAYWHMVLGSGLDPHCLSTCLAVRMTCAASAFSLLQKDLLGGWMVGQAIRVTTSTVTSCHSVAHAYICPWSAHWHGQGLPAPD